MANQIRIPKKSKVEETLELVELGKKARIVFHDLSNHFTALTLSINSLEESLNRDQERLREYSRRSETARLQIEYVSGLLRTHLKNRDCEIFNPGHETEKIVDSFRPRAGLKKIDISSDIDGKIEIFGRKSDFVHIISNLVDNALDSLESISRNKENKESKKRLVNVRLGTNGSNIFVSVWDNGCGISKENHSKIFKQNFTTKKNGHGIGLFATKEYVERSFGGNIDFKSSESGTEFFVKIPIQNNSDTKQNRKLNSFPVLQTQ